MIRKKTDSGWWEGELQVFIINCAEYIWHHTIDDLFISYSSQIFISHSGAWKKETNWLVPSILC